MDLVPKAPGWAAEGLKAKQPLVLHQMLLQSEFMKPPQKHWAEGSVIPSCQG